MHRVDTSDNVPVLPTSEAAGTAGFFSKGTGGVNDSTVPGQDWFNMVQEELNNVVESAGLTPDQTKADYTQLEQAIKLLSKLSNKQYFITSGDFTVPAGVTEIMVTVFGGGGGGGGVSGSSTKGGDGGSSSVGSVVANGGIGGYDADTGGIRNPAFHGDATGGDINLSGLGSIGGRGMTQYVSASTNSVGQTGGSGGLAIKTISVSPADIISILVGAGGVGDDSSPSTGGIDGYVIVEYK